MAIEVNTTDDGKTMTFTFSGHLTFGVWDEFRDKCLKIQHPPRIVLDLRCLDEINTAGLGMLLHLRERLGGEQTDISILVCNESIRHLLNCVSFSRWFKILEGCERQSEGAICTPGCYRLGMEV